MKLTVPEHGDQISAWLSEGLSYRQIAKQLGCNHTTVSVFVGLHFPDIRRKPLEAQETVERDVPVNALLIDIETRPNLVWQWDLYGTYTQPDFVVEPVAMISFAAKWLNDDVIYFKSEHHNSREEMVEFAHALLDKADFVLHYNGSRFDIPHLNREFVTLGMTPPSPYQQIDLLKTARYRFKFPSNKLAYVAPALGVGAKVEHEGAKLWLKCIEGDDDAWSRMRAYNIQDVVVLEELYHKLLPWIDKHPSMAVLTKTDACPNCASSNLESRGEYRTKTRWYTQYRCRDCGTYSRATKSSGSVGTTGVAA